jgi:hypothetical protein
VFVYQKHFFVKVPVAGKEINAACLRIKKLKINVPTYYVVLCCDNIVGISITNKVYFFGVQNL